MRSCRAPCTLCYARDDECLHEKPLQRVAGRRPHCAIDRAPGKCATCRYGGRMVERFKGVAMTWRSKEDRTVEENLGIEDNVSRLAWALYRKPLVMLFETDARGVISGQGSGTLVRAASGRAVILTAAHVVAGAPKMAALSEIGSFDDVIERVVACTPGRADVAIATLRDSARGLDSAAMDLGLIAEGDPASVRKGDTVDVIGFPEGMSIEVADLVGGRILHRHGDMIHRTVVAGADRDLISIIWKFGDIVEGSSALYEEAGFAIGSRVNQGKPSGISGGAVWKSLRVEGGLWAPEKAFRMIAVPTDFKDGKEHAVPTSRWLPWLRAQLAIL